MPTLRRIGTTTRVRTCSHCGKSDLARTVVFSDAAGKLKHFGSKCAAKMKSLLSRKDAAIENGDRVEYLGSAYNDVQQTDEPFPRPCVSRKIKDSTRSGAMQQVREFMANFPPRSARASVTLLRRYINSKGQPSHTRDDEIVFRAVGSRGTVGISTKRTFSDQWYWHTVVVDGVGVSRYGFPDASSRQSARSAVSAVGLKRNRALSNEDRRAASDDGYNDGRYNSDLSYEDARDSYRHFLSEHDGEATPTQKKNFFDTESDKASRELKEDMHADVDLPPSKRELLPHLLGDPLKSKSDEHDRVDAYVDMWREGFRKRLEESIED